MFDIVLIAIGLAMDAFAVSICRGLKVREVELNYSLTTALMFGFFQAMMPFIGYFAGRYFEKYITSIDHWLAFGLLALIGINLIKESLAKEEELCCENDSFRELLLMAIATSIDALAIGISFAFLKIDIFFAALVIGIITFGFSLVGVYVGHFFGSKLKSKAEMFGGLILIGIGIKILLEHLGVL